MINCKLLELCQCITKKVKISLLTIDQFQFFQFENQFGFRPNHSTNMTILKLVDQIANAADNNEITAGVFLDLSKAFDTLDHDILLKKLDTYGLRGIVLDWFRNYLTNRKQFVEYNNHIVNNKIYKHWNATGLNSWAAWFHYLRQRHPKFCSRFIIHSLCR